MGDRQAVPGDPDEADEPLVAGLDRRLERASRPERLLPLARVDEVVELDQVDPVDTHALERAVDRLPRAGRRALAGLRGEEEAVAVLGEPGAELILGVAVARGGVDVVDPVRRADSSARSASSSLRAQRAAAPKIVRVLSWPVLPNGCVGIMVGSLCASARG